MVVCGTTGRHTLFNHQRHYKFELCFDILVIICEYTKYNVRIQLSKYIYKNIVHHWYQQMLQKTIAHETADNMLNDHTSDYNLIVNALLLNSSLVFSCGLTSLIHRASRVSKVISPFEVVPRIDACSSLRSKSQSSKCWCTGPLLRCSLKRVWRCRLVWPT